MASARLSLFFFLFIALSINSTVLAKANDYSASNRDASIDKEVQAYVKSMADAFARVRMAPTPQKPAALKAYLAPLFDDEAFFGIIRLGDIFEWTGTTNPKFSLLFGLVAANDPPLSATATGLSIVDSKNVVFRFDVIKGGVKACQGSIYLSKKKKHWKGHMVYVNYSIKV